LKKKQNPLLKALEKTRKEDQNTFNKRINEVTGSIAYHYPKSGKNLQIELTKKIGYHKG